VEPSSIANDRWLRPQEWKTGAAMTVVSRARSGMRDSAATASCSVAPLRAAPRGAPVVPLVRMTCREVCCGGAGRPSGLVSASSSSCSVVSETRVAVAADSTLANSPS
jgi:hypothetical protein